MKRLLLVCVFVAVGCGPQPELVESTKMSGNKLDVYLGRYVSDKEAQQIANCYGELFPDKDVTVWPKGSHAPVADRAPAVENTPAYFEPAPAKVDSRVYGKESGETKASK